MIPRISWSSILRFFLSRPFWGVLWISQTNVAFLVTSSSCARKTYNKYHVRLWLNPYCLGVFVIDLFFDMFIRGIHSTLHSSPNFSVAQILLQSPKPGSFFLRSDNSCLFLTWWNNRRIFAETSEKSQDGAFLSLRSSPSSPHRIIPWNTDERHPEQK